MQEVDTDLVIKACEIANSNELPAIQYMIAQYQKAVHFERNQDAAMMELAIRRFVCNHNKYAV